MCENWTTGGEGGRSYQAQQIIVTKTFVQPLNTRNIDSRLARDDPFHHVFSKCNNPSAQDHDVVHQTWQAGRQAGRQAGFRDKVMCFEKVARKTIFPATCVWRSATRPAASESTVKKNTCTSKCMCTPAKKTLVCTCICLVDHPRVSTGAQRWCHPAMLHSRGAVSHPLAATRGVASWRMNHWGCGRQPSSHVEKRQPPVQRFCVGSRNHFGSSWREFVL